jgi:hypothetical protein
MALTLALLSELKERMKISCLIFFITLFLFFPGIYLSGGENEFSIFFYNVENLFDTNDNPAFSDEEFTPEGIRRWTYNRFRRKILHLSKVIMNSRGWNPPDIIGLCEIENRHVLEALLMNTPLNSYPYNIIHKDSPDSRGIDVALLYNRDVFYPLEYQCYPLKNADDSVINTREILYVKGIIGRSDTLHIFINHWPSRYSGLLESRPGRILAAKTLRSRVEKLFDEYSDPAILILGDFNDQPGDISVSQFLGAAGITDHPVPESLYNMSYCWSEEGFGTIKYRGKWFVFDQIIVSGSVLGRGRAINTEPEFAGIVKLPFLFERDERYGGKKLMRTYTGYKYNGGFSDHLPVLLKLKSVH